MANEVLVGLKIGAVVSGSLHAAFGSAKSTVQQLGRATDGLTTKQKFMGTELAASIARGGTGIERLRRQYDQVGRTIEQLKTKQERLNTSIARGETLKNRRGDLRGQAMETIGTGVALGAPVVQSMRTAIDFQDQTRDIAITGGFDEAEEKRLSDVMRGAALRWNQTQTDVAKGTGVLIAGGISNSKDLAAYAPVMAKAATATRASMDDLGSVAIALNDNLGIGAAGLERSMNMLAFAGKSGQFELADMAKWLPQLTPQFAALGVTGERAVAEIGASLQIARRGAGTNDEAANNFKNFLSKITAPDSIKAFEKAGIDLKSSMKNLVREGLSPAEAMIKILTVQLGKKAPAAAAEYGKALDLKDDQEKQVALARLDEAYKLGELFVDQQVLSFVRPALANQKDLGSIKAGSKDAADKGVLDEDWNKRMGSSKEQLKSLKTNLSDIGISVGNALLPALVDVTKALVPVMASFSAWATENPGIIKGVVGLVGGLLLGKLAFIGLAYGANLVMSPFVAMSTTITTVSAKWTLLRGMWQMGKFAPLVTGLTRIGSGLLTVARYSGLFLRGVTMALGAPLMMVARGGLFLGKILGGTLLFGLKLAGQAVLWLGRALLMNPIGLLITGIALGAYLIYRYWEPIKGFFSGLWTEIKAGFNGGLSGITGLILDFSPLGLFYRAFAGVMSYFGVELPGKFSEFGGMLVTGLINGIGNMANSLKDSVVGIGSSVKGWFTETLGIQSPSRVFMGYGANISEGAALGITAQSNLVRKAALGMAGQSKVDMLPPNPADVSRASLMGGFPSAGQGMAPGASAQPTYNFSPKITVSGGSDVRDQVGQALQAGYADWVKFMERYNHDKRRRSYGSPDEGFA
ncbi:phage tail tape measure protein [Pseudomonas lactis]|uniref:phage tail tape measure protein n=1 Tax=Pseudomonas lactis TaxID=1615674 RepID=UPI0014750CBB|nr:phage tail tape measure protein [Pseudomonas lactis]NNA49762.1 phage tail tape measure protein [Pseudomonas lactis]